MPVTDWSESAVSIFCFLTSGSSGFSAGGLSVPDVGTGAAEPDSRARFSPVDAFSFFASAASGVFVVEGAVASPLGSSDPGEVLQCLV